MKRLVRAYLDDYHKVIVKINRRFNDGKSEYFYLLDDRNVFIMDIAGRQFQNNDVVYELRLNEDIEIGREYQVMITNGYRCNLDYRFITKTERFNQEFYYTENDLGTSTVDDATRFVLWAPTASAVKLEISHNGSLKTMDMHRGEGGTYRIVIAPKVIGATYRYLVKVNGSWKHTIDPYGKASTANSERSVVVEQSAYRAVRYDLPVTEKYTDAVIYETSVRDFTKEGTFLAMSGNLDYLQQLGVTHIQLMPVNDFGSVDELHPELYYNWGYDPVQYQCLEGSYSSNVSLTSQVNYDFKKLVETIHEKGMKVNLDVVFNHVYDLVTSSFDLTVPYYYFRYGANGQLSDGSYCGNDLDTNQLMMRKYIIDTLTYYVEQFDIDGFRFDLMGILDVGTMQMVNDTLRKIKPDIMLYGEGWEMNTALPNEQKASKNNRDKLPGFAFFNDQFRDIIKGSTFDVYGLGYGTGKTDLIAEAEKCFQGLMLGSPDQSINYVECHDDMTCYDKLRICCLAEGEENIIKRQQLLLGCVLLAQGIPFIHSGEEHCRSKNGISNSYNRSDSINKLKPEEREKYSNVVEYVRKLIRIRKKYRLSRTEDEVRNDITFDKKDGCLIYKIANCPGNRTLTVLINPTRKTVEYDISHQEIIFGNGIIEPISITILGSDSND